MKNAKTNGRVVTLEEACDMVNGLTYRNARLRKQCRSMRRQVWFLRAVVVLMGCLAWLIG